MIAAAILCLTLARPDPKAGDPPLRSELAAFGLSFAGLAPTAGFGPSFGHLYAGETEHFFATGGVRLAVFVSLVVLEQFGPGTPPLYAVIQPHVSRSLAAYPVTYPLDLVLVALWWGSALYDLIDSVFAAQRANARAALRKPLRLRPSPTGLALLEF